MTTLEGVDDWEWELALAPSLISHTNLYKDQASWIFSIIIHKVVIILLMYVLHAKSLQSCLTLCYPGPYPARLFCPWDSPGKNTRVGCHALLPRSLPNPGIEFVSLTSPALAGGFFTIGFTWEAQWYHFLYNIFSPFRTCIWLDFLILSSMLLIHLKYFDVKLNKIGRMNF